MAVVLDPFTIIKEVHWRDPREAVYLTTSALWSKFGVTFNQPETAMPPGGPYSSDFPNYKGAYTQALEMRCVRDEYFYSGPPALFDVDGQFVAHAEAGTYTINKPGMTVAAPLDTWEVWDQDFGGGWGNVLLNNFPTGPTVPLFAGYIAGEGRFIAQGLHFTGPSQLLDDGEPNDGFGTVMHEEDQTISPIVTFVLQPSSVTYKGRTFLPIGARHTRNEQFTPDLSERYPAMQVEVLFQRS